MGSVVVGAKVSGVFGASEAMWRSVSGSVGAGYRRGGTVCSVVCSDMGRSTEVSVCHDASEWTRVSGVCEVRSAKEMPVVSVGVASRLNEATEVRGKVSSDGVVSGCYKVCVDNKMNVMGSVSVDARHLNDGKHKIGMGLEFLF